MTETNEEFDVPVAPVDFEKYLKGLRYPANRDAIVNQARENGADDKVLNFMSHFPDQEYSGPVEIQRYLRDSQKVS